MFFGKLIGGLLGYLSAGFIGAVIGLWVGSFFDRGLGRAMGFNYGAEREKLQRLFFETTFQAMGHLAKADGRISEEEIAQAEALMTRIGLTAEHRQQAVKFFQQGALADFKLEPVLARFIAEGGRNHNLPALLLEFLISVAMADGELHPAEQVVLRKTASQLGINERQFERLLEMLLAQENFRGFEGGANYVPRADELKQAYQALGVDESIDDKALKKAYRKLMSQHHPDKLIAQGVPDDMLKMATEKAQEIQAAYELIKKSRQ